MDGMRQGMMQSSVPIDVFGNFGYSLMAGQSATLTFSGHISFGFAFGGQTPPGVISGDQYDITVLGLQALAESIVVAS
jgi:hypothetical protein